MSALDEAIIASYRRFRVPADQLVADHELSEKFAVTVAEELGEPLRVDLTALRKLILNLRRRGEANGGLPRLERDYNGRRQKPR
jgi:hypothetical protein